MTPALAVSLAGRTHQTVTPAWPRSARRRSSSRPHRVLVDTQGHWLASRAVFRAPGVGLGRGQQPRVRRNQVPSLWQVHSLVQLQRRPRHVIRHHTPSPALPATAAATVVLALEGVVPVATRDRRDTRGAAAARLLACTHWLVIAFEAALVRRGARPRMVSYTVIPVQGRAPRGERAPARRVTAPVLPVSHVSCR